MYSDMQDMWGVMTHRLINTVLSEKQKVNQQIVAECLCTGINQHDPSPRGL